MVHVDAIENFAHVLPVDIDIRRHLLLKVFEDLAELECAIKVNVIADPELFDLAHDLDLSAHLSEAVDALLLSHNLVQVLEILVGYLALGAVLSFSSLLDWIWYKMQELAEHEIVDGQIFFELVDAVVLSLLVLAFIILRVIVVNLVRLVELFLARHFQ